MNKVLLRGNLGVDPTLRYTPAGQPVCNFTLATNERYRNRDGELVQRTEWHRIVVWGRPAENCAEYLKKGRQVFVEGSLRTRKWEDKEGLTRYTTEIHTVMVDFFGGADQGKQQQKAQPQRPAAQKSKSQPSQRQEAAAGTNDDNEPDDLPLDDNGDYTPPAIDPDDVPF